MRIGAYIRTIGRTSRPRSRASAGTSGDNARAAPTCPSPTLTLHVNFPDCWDGKRLDSPDHHTHMAYSSDYRCPASHPVKVPLIRLNIRYPITDGHGVVLASGGQLTVHADFFNAWDKGTLERLVDQCFHDHPCNDPRRKPKP